MKEAINIIFTFKEMVLKVKNKKKFKFSKT
jgi:hypothetical protein